MFLSTANRKFPLASSSPWKKDAASHTSQVKCSPKSLFPNHARCDVPTETYF